MDSVRFSLLLWLVLPASLAAQACTKPGWNPLAPRVQVAQSQLTAVKLQDEMDEAVPTPLEAQILALKDALAAFAAGELECVLANADAKSIETLFAGILEANQPEKQEVHDANKPPQLDHIYGSNLRVKVTRPESEPQLLLVEFNRGIACSFDSLLLGYQQQGGVWTEVLRWQSPVYDRISGAFGDFFDYQVLPQPGTKGWLIAVAHGTPWCTSRWSGFGLDLIRPALDGNPQRVLQHIDEGYVRFEIEPTFKLEPDGFQLCLQTGMIDTDVMTRIGIYRYRVNGTQLERVQPIAMNGRDFVDEWLQSPWDDASRWSAAVDLEQSKQVHEKIATALHSTDYNDLPTFIFGPVRGCTDAKTHYQVELDQAWRDGKGNSRPGSSTYFQIEEGKNSFTMLSAAANADPRCTGPDIMAKH